MLRKLTCRHLLFASTLLATSLVLADEPQGESAPGEFPQPTEQHKQMARDAGEWEGKMKLWHTPDADPVETTGVETNKMFGPFWLVSEFKADLGGVEYTGRGQMTYDPVAKKYTGVWYDALTPYMMTMEGTYDVETNTLTMETEGRNPATKKIEKGKVVSKYIDENHKKFELYGTGPDGKSFKMMQVDYTRRKK